VAHFVLNQLQFFGKRSTKIMSLADQFEADLFDDEVEVADGATEDGNKPIIENTIKSNDTIVQLEQKQSMLEDHVAKIDQFIKSGRQLIGGASLQDDVEYPYIIESNRIILDVDNDINVLFKLARDAYSKKFPELETHVLSPIDYARVVKRIGNETDLTSLNMSDILSNNHVMIVKVTASHSIASKTRISENDLALVFLTCDLVLNFDRLKGRILDYVSSRMTAVAPNLSAVVGTRIAAQLIGIAGGLSALSKLPATVVQGLGKDKKILGGLSSRQDSIRYVGFIGECDLIHRAPPDLRVKAGRMISTKSVLAVRVDSCHRSSDGAEGRKWRQEIEDAIREWQEPPPAKQEKPLPVPEESGQKTRRGGKKARREKELTRATEIRKKYNRLTFGADAPEDEYMDTGKGMGMLGQEGSSIIRLTPKETRGLLSKKQKEKLLGTATSTSSGLHTPHGLRGTASITSGTATQLRTGLASSLSFTPVQGIELENPMNAKVRQEVGKKREKYFSNTATFKKPRLMGPPE
jgi:U4/U6 small nuclear ribonucleoprotein PRP31